MSVAVGSVMDSVKAKKMDAMRRIKKLSNEKTKNHEKMKSTKELYGKVKKELEKGMEIYKKVNAEFDSMEDGEAKDAKEEELAALLDKIEKKRGQLVKAKQDISVMKLHEEEVEEELLEVRAELVANADLLDQNESLRKKIVEEERAKFDAVKDEYLAKELAIERDKIEKERVRLNQQQGDNRRDLIRNLGKLKVEMKKDASGMEVLLKNQVEMLEGEKKRMEAEMAGMRVEMNQLEERVVEAESALEERSEELEIFKEERGKLRAENDEKELEMQEVLRREETGLDRDDGDGSMKMVGVLMDGFNEERAKMEQKNEELRKLLGEALGDVVYLQKKVMALSREKAMRGEGR
jgi:chromosome segregation ATPase